MLKKNKIILVLLLTIFCLSIGSVCAADIDASAIPNDQAVIDDNTEINDEIIVDNKDISKVNAAAKPVEEAKITEVSSNYAYYEEIDDIADAAKNYAAYIEKYHKLPKTVKVGAHTYSHEDFTYLMGRAIQDINNGNWEKIQGQQLKSYSPVKDKVNVTLSKSRYLVLVKTDLDLVKKNGKHPNYIKLSDVKNNIRYDTYSYAYAKILRFYKEGYDKNGSIDLPNTCVFDSSVFTSITPPGPDPKPVGTKVTINQILAAAKKYQKSVKEYGELPEYVTIGDNTFSKQQFTYAMAQAIYQLSNGNKNDITIPSSVKMCTLKTDKCNRYYTKNQYIGFAKVVADYVKGNNAVPSYVKYDGTVVPHIAYAAAFANILSSYKDNGKFASKALFTTNGLGYPAAGDGVDDGYPYGVDADALKDSQNNAASNNVNSNSKNLPATGNPILVLLFALAVLPILRIKK